MFACLTASRSYFAHAAYTAHENVRLFGIAIHKPRCVRSAREYTLEELMKLNQKSGRLLR